jgi:hypothetical protein
MLRSARTDAASETDEAHAGVRTAMADEESFKVTDRRGRAREAEPAERAAPAPAPESARAEPPRPATAPSAPEAARAGEGAADLSGLIVMFASSALMSLGAAPDPMTGERHVDLDQAQGTIDILLLLREKTRGNRTEQESRLLEEILYDLQLRFVRVTESGPTAS